MVKKSLLDRFIKQGGYDLVKKEGETWRGTAEAARKTGLGEQTVRRLLREHPVAPPKGLPKYVEEFHKSEGYAKFKRMFGNKSKFAEEAALLRKGWLILNKKDPDSWQKEDYGTLWNHEEFIHPDLGGVPEFTASAFHNLMRATDRHDLLAVYKGKKFPKGKKREWFLEDEDFPPLLSQYEENETLVMTAMGIATGGRFSSLSLMKPNEINRKDLVLTAREPKVTKIYTRFLVRSVMDLIMKYIQDYNIQPDSLLFTQGYSFYLVQMKHAGKRANIPKTISTHILKHTFVTQASRHGVSAEVITEQTGTEMRTLEAHYRAKNPAKIRHELLGEKYEYVPFPEWIDSLMPFFMENYERIKRAGNVYDGMRSRLVKP